MTKKTHPSNTSGQEATAKEATIMTRPPVIVVMGHIDHGKSSLLDYIRKSNIIAGEAGGITQHVSAYEVEHKGEDGSMHKITFLDTPGHEAFGGLRKRGVKVADIAILVVSAEDGVKPQTIDALKCIKEAGIPYIVAINKIDLSSANIERTKQSLAEHEIFVESYGGEVPAIPVSAKTGEGIPQLLDMMLLVSEMGQLSADHSSLASGIVLESRLDPKKGISATLIIRSGIMKMGNYIVSGDAIAPLRIMENFLGKNIKEALVSSPVVVIGWSKQPKVGEIFHTFESRKEAENFALKASAKISEEKDNKRSSTPTEKKTIVIPLVLRTDVIGSLEAILEKISKLKNDSVEFNVIQEGIGAISENDVKLALANPLTLVVGFHTKADTRAVVLAENMNITIHQFDIIYKLLEWLENLLSERKPHVEVEESTGLAKVVRVFSVNKDKQIIGGKVESGTLIAGSGVKIMRRDAHVGDGKIKGLQRLKEKANEAEEGQEFGAMIESKIELAPGDRLESVKIVKKQI
jgi:translation initiation factor IF-2